MSHEEQRLFLAPSSSYTVHSPELGSLAIRGNSLSSYWDEVKESWSLAWPMVFTYLCQQTGYLFGMAYVGHLGAAELGAASLGNMFCNLTGVVIGFGLATALDTLTSQAWGAGDARSRAMVGLHSQRMAFLLLLCTAPVGFLWMRSTTPLLLWTGQAPEVAALAGDYTRFAFPGLYALYVSEIAKRFLQVQGKSTYILLASSGAAAAAPFLLWLLIYSPTPLAMGFTGCPLALALVNIFLCALLLSTIALRPDCRSGGVWRGWTWKALDLCSPDARALFALGIPGLIMLGAEWGAFEGLSILAGLCGPPTTETSALGQSAVSHSDSHVPYLSSTSSSLFYFGDRATSLAAHSVAANTLTFLFMVPMGLADAAAVRVGDRLGSGDAMGARAAAAANVGLIFCSEAVLGSSVFTFRGLIARCYSSDAAVLAICDDLFALLATLMIFDGCQAVCAGALRGAGKQNVAAVVNVFAFYLVGIPLSAYLGLSLRWGVIGIWGGIGVSFIIQVACYAFILIRLDWNAAAVEAAARTNEGCEESEAGNGRSSGDSRLAISQQYK